MFNFRRIIIPVDNSKYSKEAVINGAYLAKILNIDAKIITVNDTHQFISSVILEDKLKKEANIFLEGFKKIAEDLGVKMETELMTGKPAEEIVKFVKKDDMIIIAHHDKTRGIDKAMEKSVLKEVVQNAPCAVLVIKSEKNEDKK
jgi:nucleotide-binding universal stress UspA family protein